MVEWSRVVEWSEGFGVKRWSGVKGLDLSDGGSGVEWSGMGCSQCSRLVWVEYGKAEGGKGGQIRKKRSRRKSCDLLPKSGRREDSRAQYLSLSLSLLLYLSCPSLSSNQDSYTLLSSPLLSSPLSPSPYLTHQSLSSSRPRSFPSSHLPNLPGIFEPQLVSQLF